ncbi:MAG: hypothetical protein ACI8QD_001919, partial [Cyclobacteriaceae bacterium]
CNQYVFSIHRLLSAFATILYMLATCLMDEYSFDPSIGHKPTRLVCK